MELKISLSRAVKRFNCLLQHPTLNFFAVIPKGGEILGIALQSHTLLRDIFSSTAKHDLLAKPKNKKKRSDSPDKSAHTANAASHTTC
jgi:hypothetical protein